MGADAARPISAAPDPVPLEAGLLHLPAPHEGNGQRKSCWPADRDLATFRAWFRIELFPVLVDSCEGAIGEETPPEA